MDDYISKGFLIDIFVDLTVRQHVHDEMRSIDVQCIQKENNISTF